MKMNGRKASRKWKHIFFNVSVKYPVCSISLVVMIAAIITYALFYTKVDTYRKVNTTVAFIESHSNAPTIKLKVTDRMNSEEVKLLTSSPIIYLITNEQSYTLKLINHNIEHGINILTCTIEDAEHDSIPLSNHLEYYAKKVYLWEKVVGAL